MAAQRPPELAPAIRASADELPLRDGSVDAAMAVLTVHHWDEGQETRRARAAARGARAGGAAHLRREVSGRMWLMADYLPELAALDRRIFPSPERLAGWLGGAVEVEPVPIPRDTPDWMLGSFWAHPERVLDRARAGEHLGLRAHAGRCGAARGQRAAPRPRGRQLGRAPRRPAHARRARCRAAADRRPARGLERGAHVAWRPRAARPRRMRGAGPRRHLRRPRVPGLGGRRRARDRGPELRLESSPAPGLPARPAPAGHAGAASQARCRTPPPRAIAASSRCASTGSGSRRAEPIGGGCGATSAPGAACAGWRRARTNRFCSW